MRRRGLRDFCDHLSGLEALPVLNQRCPRTRIVVFSMHADEAFVLEALRLGARGYVLKSSLLGDLGPRLRSKLSP